MTDKDEQTSLHLKEIFGVANSSKEIVPQCHLSLPGTESNCLQEVRELLDELHHTREKSI